ncbi:MAG: hypothetical protein AB1384_04495 [Actinomycetota bacterium]
MRGDDMRGGGAGESRWRRWAGYALGMFIEAAAVGAISLAALGLMFLVKALVT